MEIQTREKILNFALQTIRYKRKMIEAHDKIIDGCMAKHGISAEYNPEQADAYLDMAHKQLLRVKALRQDINNLHAAVDKLARRK